MSTSTAASRIRPRPRATYSARIILSLAFALLGAPILMAPAWVTDAARFQPGQAAPVTLRVPIFLGSGADDLGAPDGIVTARGEVVTDPAAIDRARALRPTGWGAWLVHAAGLFLVGLLYTAQLARSHKGRILRIQAVLLGFQLAVAVVAGAALLFTPIAAVALPAGLLVICTAVAVDLGAALATAAVGALLVGGLTPFDPGVIAVLALQGAAAALFLGERSPRRVAKRRLATAGAAGGAAAALSYVLIFYLARHHAPTAELASPLRSAWLAAGAAGVLAAFAAMPLVAGFQRAIGDITLAALIELEDLSHPLLEQIAESSPGTWQHSLAMANMAQIAANTIGADGRLVRVGAYFHDLGKSLAPKYFIENLTGGEPSPHDALPPRASCEAIFRHVTEGVRVARRHGLHERIVDFMHMHHGDGLLEYFWVKCLEQGNPEHLTEEDFRYPGVRPHSKETGILAVCDAVEAASRTLRNPDAQAVAGLVQRIVYGKLHRGQLDDSGLTIADLRLISDSLLDTIVHAHHGRIEYQWQRREDALATADMAPARTRQDANGRATEDLRDARLDSQGGPRPVRRSRSAGRTGPIATAATEPMVAGPAALTRPPTAAEVARATARTMAAIAPASGTPDPVESESWAAGPTDESGAEPQPEPQAGAGDPAQRS